MNYVRDSVSLIGYARGGVPFIGCIRGGVAGYVRDDAVFVSLSLSCRV